MTSRTRNRVILVGPAGRDPEVRETTDGKVATFAIATTDAPDGTLPAPKTMWHRLVLRDQLAEFAATYVANGDRVYVEGSLAYDSYERDGVTIPIAEVRVTEIVILSPSTQPH